MFTGVVMLHPRLAHALKKQLISFVYKSLSITYRR